MAKDLNKAMNKTNDQLEEEQEQEQKQNAIPEPKPKNQQNPLVVQEAPLINQPDQIIVPLA